jgi:phage-related protein
MLTKVLLTSGSKLDIYVIEQDGVSQVSDFIEALPSPELGKVSRLLDVLKDQGPPSNEEKFKNEGKGIYALKTTDTRIYGFFYGKKSFVLAIGFMKNKNGGKKVERRYCAQAEELYKALS